MDVESPSENWDCVLTTHTAGWSLIKYALYYAKAWPFPLLESQECKSYKSLQIVFLGILVSSQLKLYLLPKKVVTTMSQLEFMAAEAFNPYYTKYGNNSSWKAICSSH